MNRSSHAVRLAAFLCLASSLAACSGGGDGGSSPPPGNPPVISTFSPTSGGAGTEVTITGLLFAETPGGNTVRFNGVTATVLSASATSLVAVVPAGASTGKIGVTTAGGSATSSADFTVVTGPGSAWTTRLAGPRGRQSGLAWTGTRFAAVGSGAAGFQTSPDGLVWKVTSSLSSADDVAWDGSQMVAVGNTVRTSPDGLTWTLRSAMTDLRRVTKAPGGWVAVGDQGVIRTSPDGLTWTARESGVTKDLRGVTWTGAQLVAVGEDGAVTTSPDGVAWTARPAPTNDSFTAVGSSSALVVATTFPYSGSQTALLTTPDGVTWTPRTVPELASFNRVIHAGGRFVGVGFYRAYTSPDGSDWTAATDVPGIPEAVVHTGSEYVATGSDRNSAGAAFTSSDGLSWKMRSADHDLLALARRPSDGLLVVIGSDVTRTSSDGGETWALHLLTPILWENYPFLDVVWSPKANAFIALVQVAANPYVYRSSDGESWSRIDYSACAGGLAISDAGRLLATGTSLTGACVATSDDDGATWTTHTPPAGGRLRKAFWLGGQFVAVGDTGAIATSPDGASWTPRASGVTGVLRGAAASPAGLVAVGDGGAIVASADGGVTWTPRTSGTSYTLRRVTWTGSAFLAVGSAGKLLRSADGASWTTVPTPYSAGPSAHDLNDLAALPDGTGRLVLVGSGGLMATSP